MGSVNRGINVLENWKQYFDANQKRPDSRETGDVYGSQHLVKKEPIVTALPSQ